MNQTLTYKLLSLSDKKEWSHYLESLPEQMQDVFYGPEYYQIYEKNGDGKAYCFIYEDEGNVALYPFLLNKINDLGYELDDFYYDIQGAYGYNGVVYSSDDPEFIRNFYDEFDEFCKEKNIIAEFTRFHPLLKNHKFSKGYLDVIYNRQTVYVDLTKGYEFIYDNYSRKIRRALRSAEKNKITVKVFENDTKFFSEFVESYKETMHRVNADKYYYFSEEYFHNLFSNLPTIQFVVFKGDEPIAASICIYGKKFFHNYLAYSKEKYLSFHPNEIIYDAKIRYALEKKFTINYLGGGKSSADDDSLLEFKKKFSKTLNNFYIGTKKHDGEVLNNIYKQWEIKYPHLIDKYKNTFLKYRNISE